MAGETEQTTTTTAAPVTAPVDGKTATPEATQPADGSMLTAPTDAKPDPKAAETKPADAKTTAAAPVPVELRLPEGFSDKDPLIAGFKTTAEKLGLRSEQAQGILDVYAKDLSDAVAADNAKRTVEVQAWRAAVKADPDIGGAKLEESLNLANRAIDRFGGQDLRKAFHAAGLLDHPVNVKAWAQIGRSLKEDTVRGAPGAAPQVKTEDEMFREMYPNTKF